MVMTPSAETFSMASAMSLPMKASPEETVPTRAMSSVPLTFWLCWLRSGHASTKESEQFQRRLNRYRERYLFPDENVTETEDKQA